MMVSVMVVKMMGIVIAMVMVVMIVMVTCGSVEVPLVSQMNLKCFTTAATMLKYYIQLRAICQYCVFYCCEENMGQLSPSKAVCPCSAFMA